MKLRRLGKTNLSISEVGLGAWQLGADWGKPVNEDTALAILRCAVNGGGNFIDTADVYGMGRSERLIGQFLKSRSERVYVATKQGRFPGWEDSYAVMKQHTIASLQRLEVEALDLLQLHCIPFEILKRGEVFTHLDRLKQEGLILHYGVSVESVEEALFCFEQEGIAALQVIFNMFRQKLVTELFPKAKEKDVGIIARVPLASGVLAGKFATSHQFPSNDHRHFNADGQVFNVGETFSGVPFDQGIQFASEIRQFFTNDFVFTPAQLALRWILDHDAVSTTIPGATRVEQVIANNQATRINPIPDEIHQQIQTMYREKIASAIRGAY